MWEAINNVLTGQNSLQTLVFLILVIIIATLLIKGKYLSIRTPHVKLGTDERERAVLRQQIEWTYNYVSGLYGVISAKYPDIEPLKTRYVLECIYDEIVNWISFNHITRSEMYVMVKQEKLRGLVFSMDINEAIRSEEFRKMMDGWTNEIINRLVDIREYYER